MRRGARGWVNATVLLLLLVAPASAQVSPQEFADRRASLAESIQEGLLLAVGNAEPPQDYLSFYQGSPFRYLTGFTEPNAALIMVVEGGAVVQETLFVNPRDPNLETWEGYRLGPVGAHERTGISSRAVEDLHLVVDSLVGNGWSRVELVGAYHPGALIRNDVTQRVQELFASHPDVDLRTVNDQVARLRQVKSPAELAMIRKAAAITVQAHEEVLGAMSPEMNEFEIQALIEYTFRRYGAERPAFSSIVGSGPNSTVLHYNTNDRFMAAGDVVVIDIGASYGGYAADVTRTIPVSGSFSEAQREIYHLVRDTQAAAEAMGRPGVSVAQMSQEATRILASGLAELGLIESPNATFEDELGRVIPQYFLYYMHALGHGIGLDVHDPWPGVLQPGVAFTIEPGIYVRPNLLTEVVPDTPANRQMRAALAPAIERYVNIGVRIEDDYIVTADGLERISPAPREIDEIEAMMSGSWSAPEDRNAEWVEWYRVFP